MQVKNIIISLAAVLALVQAAPTDKRPLVNQVPESASTKMYEVCMEKIPESPKVRTNPQFIDDAAFPVCSSCAVEGAEKCNAEYALSNREENSSDLSRGASDFAAEKCYTEYMDECQERKIEELLARSAAAAAASS